MHEFLNHFQSKLRLLLGEHVREAEKRPRVAPRNQLGIPVLCLKGRRELKVRLLDVSEKGMRLFLEEPLEKDDTVFVHSSPEDETAPDQHVNCRVVWCRGQSQDWEAGLEFNPSDENVFQAWLSKPSLNVPSSP